MIQFDDHIFQLGWFNHQLVFFFARFGGCDGPFNEECHMSVGCTLELLNWKTILKKPHFGEVAAVYLVPNRFLPSLCFRRLFGSILALFTMSFQCCFVPSPRTVRLFFGGLAFSAQKKHCSQTCRKLPSAS